MPSYVDKGSWHNAVGLLSDGVTNLVGAGNIYRGEPAQLQVPPGYTIQLVYGSVNLFLVDDITADEAAVVYLTASAVNPAGTDGRLDAHLVVLRMDAQVNEIGAPTAEVISNSASNPRTLLFSLLPNNRQRGVNKGGNTGHTGWSFIEVSTSGSGWFLVWDISYELIWHGSSKNFKEDDEEQIMFEDDTMGGGD